MDTGIVDSMLQVKGALGATAMLFGSALIYLVKRINASEKETAELKVTLSKQLTELEHRMELVVQRIDITLGRLMNKNDR